MECPNPFRNKKTSEGINCCFWFKTLWDRAMSLFKWEGDVFENKNSTLNADYLEWSLLNFGSAAFVKDENGNFRALNCTRVGLDPYGFPEKVLIANPVLGTFERDLKDSAVWIRGNKFATPAIENITYYATQMAKVQTSLNVSLSNNRLTNVFCAESDEQVQAIRKMIDDVDSGKLAVVQKPDIFKQIMGDKGGMNVYSTPSNYLADKYIQNMREIVNDFYASFGVNTNGANLSKNERNLVDEVNSNNQQILINREFWFAPRKEAARRISELFGIEVDVRIVGGEENAKFFDQQSGDESSDNL